MDCPILKEYVDHVGAILSRNNETVSDKVAAIVPLKMKLLESRAICPERFFEGLERVPYTRNLLHADPDGRFTVMALAWGPGKRSPAHDHETWGVVGCYDGTIEVRDYDPTATDCKMVERERYLIKTGDVLEIHPPREENIHCMGNALDEAPTLTIHTYGDPGTICQVYDLKSGRTAQKPLRFHHQL